LPPEFLVVFELEVALGRKIDEAMLAAKVAVIGHMRNQVLQVSLEQILGESSGEHGVGGSGDRKRVRRRSQS
jgi:hypothetical protein